MTYKQIVSEMVRVKAVDWFRSVLCENNIAHNCITRSEVIELEQDRQRDTVYWSVRTGVLIGSRSIDVIIGGTVDDMCGICCSCIWAADHHTILWMAVADARRVLGINELKLA